MIVVAQLPGQTPSFPARGSPLLPRPTLVPRLPFHSFRLLGRQVHLRRRRSTSRDFAASHGSEPPQPRELPYPDSLFLHVLDEYAGGRSPSQSAANGGSDELHERWKDSDALPDERIFEADSTVGREWDGKDVNEERGELRTAAQQSQHVAADTSGRLESSGLERASEATRLSRDGPPDEGESSRWHNSSGKDFSEKRSTSDVETGRLRGLGDERRCVDSSTDAQSIPGRSSGAEDSVELQISRERSAPENDSLSHRPSISYDEKEDTDGQAGRSSIEIEVFPRQGRGLKVGRQVFLTGQQDYMRWMPSEDRHLQGSVVDLPHDDELQHSSCYNGEADDSMQPANGNAEDSVESEDEELELAEGIDAHLSVETDEAHGRESSPDLFADFLKSRSEQWGDVEGGQMRKGGLIVDHSKDSSVVHKVKTPLRQPQMNTSSNNYENSLVNFTRENKGCTSREGVLSPQKNLSEIASSSAGDDEQKQLLTLTQEIVSLARNLPLNASLETFLDSYSGEISNSDGNTVLQALGEERLAWPMLHFFQWMRVHEPSLLDSRSFCILFTHLGRLGRMDQGLLQYKNMPNSQNVHCVQVYNSLLGALVRCNRPEDIPPILQAMEDRNVHRDTVTYSILINATKEGNERVNEVWRIFDRMLMEGVRPSVSVYGSLIKAFCDEGHLKEALLAALSMEKMEISPNVIIYNTLIDAHGKALQLEEAEGLFMEMKERGLSPTQSTYNTLINAYGRSGQVDIAEELLVEMQREGLRPNVATYTSLISAYGKQRMSEKAASVFLRMNRAGLVATTHTYTALINAYAEGGWHDKAQGAFDKMVRAGLNATVETYTALLDAYRRAGDLEMVRSLWSTMRQDGCELTRVAYCTVMDAFSKHGQWAEARDVMDAFRKRGFEPDTMIFNMLLNAYARGGMHTKLPKVMAELQAAGCIPNAFTYCTLIYAFIRLRDFTSAFKYNKEMLQNGALPDRRTYKKMKFILDGKYTLKLENDRKANAGQDAARPVNSSKNPQRAKRMFKRYQKYGPLRGSERTKALWKDKEKYHGHK